MRGLKKPLPEGRGVITQGPSEHAVQSQILQYLAIKQVMCWRNNSGSHVFFYRGQRRYVKYGALGSPDIFAVVGGRVYGIEVKGPRGKQSASQKDFQQRFERAGGKYVLAFSLEDVTGFFEGALRVVTGPCVAAPIYDVD